jgi:hypothetical protein
MKKVSVVAKERRSSVGFFDFVRFVVSWVEEGLAQRRKDAKVERGGESGAGDLQPQKGEKLAQKENPNPSSLFCVLSRLLAANSHPSSETPKLRLPSRHGD